MLHYRLEFGVIHGNSAVYIPVSMWKKSNFTVTHDAIRSITKIDGNYLAALMLVLQ